MLPEACCLKHVAISLKHVAISLQPEACSVQHAALELHHFTLRYYTTVSIGYNQQIGSCCQMSGAEMYGIFSCRNTAVENGTGECAFGIVTLYEDAPGLLRVEFYYRLVCTWIGEHHAFSSQCCFGNTNGCGCIQFADPGTG